MRSADPIPYLATQAAALYNGPCPIPASVLLQDGRSLYNVGHSSARPIRRIAESSICRESPAVAYENREDGFRRLRDRLMKTA
ncbi:MAG: hypothetical protein JOZ32_12020 [Bryobacterales bacterium]|nr:hypothetical protein [Bryobacterales bacterium]